MNATDLVTIALAAQSYVVQMRQALHQIPEPRYATEKTRAFILAEVVRLGEANANASILAFHKPRVSKGGIVLDIDVADATDRIILRTDIDALMVTEATGLPFSSLTPGVMHACGHDIHAAMMLGFLRCVVEGKITPTHNIRVVFDDAEENPGTAPEPLSGLELLIRDNGLTDGIKAAYGLHIWNTETGTSGTFFSRSGPMMGNSGRFCVKAENTGSHPVPMRRILHRLDTFRARRIDPCEPVTLEPVILKMRSAGFTPQLSKQAVKVTITARGGHIMSPHQPSVNALHAALEIMDTFGPLCGSEGMAVRSGTGSNILPAKAEIWFFATEMEDQMEYNLKVCQEVGQNFGVESVQVELTSELPDDIAPGTFELWYGFRTMLHRDRHLALMDAMEAEIRSACGPDVKILEIKKIGGHPALINNGAEYDKVIGLLRQAGQPTAVVQPILGGESFAHPLYKVPGCNCFLGAHTPTSGGDHHAPTFNPDELVYWKGVLYWLLVATSKP